MCILRISPICALTFRRCRPAVLGFAQAYSTRQLVAPRDEIFQNSAAKSAPITEFELPIASASAAALLSTCGALLLLMLGGAAGGDTRHDFGGSQSVDGVGNSPGALSTEVWVPIGSQGVYVARAHVGGTAEFVRVGALADLFLGYERRGDGDRREDRQGTSPPF